MTVILLKGPHFSCSVNTSLSHFNVLNQDVQQLSLPSASDLIITRLTMMQGNQLRSCILCVCSHVKLPCYTFLLHLEDTSISKTVRLTNLTGCWLYQRSLQRTLGPEVNQKPQRRHWGLKGRDTSFLIPQDCCHNSNGSYSNCVSSNTGRRTVNSQHGATGD